MLDQAFLALMPLRVTVEPYSSGSTTGYSKRSYGSAITLRARYEPVGYLTKNAQQKDVASRGLFIMDVDSSDGTRHVCSVSDRITIPTSIQATGIHPNPPIITAEPVYDETGLHHQVVRI